MSIVCNLVSEGCHVSRKEFDGICRGRTGCGLRKAPWGARCLMRRGNVLRDPASVIRGSVADPSCSHPMTDSYSHSLLQPPSVKLPLLSSFTHASPSPSAFHLWTFTISKPTFATKPPPSSVNFASSPANSPRPARKSLTTSCLAQQALAAGFCPRGSEVCSAWLILGPQLTRHPCYKTPSRLTKIPTKLPAEAPDLFHSVTTTYQTPSECAGKLSPLPKPLVRL